MPLTQEQKELVIMYRNSGVGYRHTATMIGVKRDQVRSVCSSFGLIGLYGKQNERAYCECRICGKKYLIEDGLSKTHCSIKCKEVSVELVLKRRIKKKTFVCITCGKEFVRNGSQVYCSSECRYEDRACEVCGNTYRVKKDSKNICCSTKCGEIKRRKSHEEYYREFSQIYKGRIVPITVYNGSNNDMTVYCIECGTTTTRSAGRFVDRHSGCRKCGRRLSTGEDNIKNWLTDNDIKFISQYTPKDSLLVFKLRYDFAILNDDGSVKMLIEYNGRQHYEPVESFGGQKEFVRQVESDSAKKWYAKDRRIPLISISYTQRKELNDILTDTLLSI